MNQKVIVFVKVIEARDISPVENKGELLDAFAQVRLGEFDFKTAVCRRSTCPVWRDEIFRFEVDEKTLFDEPLQIRLLDHESYTANDTIGSLLLSLVTLLNFGSPYKVDGWLPLLDPVHGIRGELHIAIKIELLSQVSRPRSLCVLNSPMPPVSPKLLQMLGLVDDVLVDADPESQWRDKLRSARASDDALQLIFARLAIELQQRVASRAADLGGNAVIGYRQIVEIDGVGGLIARAIGTAVFLDNHITGPHSTIYHNSKQDPFLSSDSPFFTLSSYPTGCVLHMGGMMTVRAVRIATDTSDSKTAEMYRKWFSELKQELKLQLELSGYNAAIGYREKVSIFRGLVVVSACATAAVLSSNSLSNILKSLQRQPNLTKSLDRNILGRENLISLENHTGCDIEDGEIERGGTNPCQMFHVPAEKGIPGLGRCQRNDCLHGMVPNILLSTVDPPTDAVIPSSTGLFRSCVTRQRRRDISIEIAAKEVSDAMPYLEHEFYRDMLGKMKLAGWNAIFNLDVQLTIGEDLIILTGTGTGTFVKTLPPVSGSVPLTPESPNTPMNSMNQTPPSSCSSSSPQSGAPSHLSSFALIYKIPPNQSHITWPEKVLQIAKFRCRKARISTLSAIKLRLVMNDDEEHWLLTGAAMGLPPSTATINPSTSGLQHHSSSSSLFSTSLLAAAVPPTPAIRGCSARVISTVLPSLLPSFSTKRHLFRMCVTVVRESDDLSVVIAEALELLRASAALFGATAVLAVHIDLCQNAEHQSVVVVSGDTAVINAVRCQTPAPTAE